MHERGGCGQEGGGAEAPRTGRGETHKNCKLGVIELSRD